MKQMHTPAITQLILPRVGSYPSKTPSKVSTTNGLRSLTVAAPSMEPSKATADPGRSLRWEAAPQLRSCP